MISGLMNSFVTTIFKRGSKLLFLLIINTVFIIGTLEVILRLFFPNSVNFLHSRVSNVLLFENIPSYSFTYSGKEFRNTIKYNSLGFRGKEYSQDKRNDTFRIAVLGDSFVEGLQLPDNQLLTAILEEKLNSYSQSLNYEVMNFGVSGYGTDQELLLLTNKVIQYSPDLVILVFTANDIDDVKNNELFTMENGILTKLFPKTKNYSITSLLKKTFKNFYFLNFLDQNLHRLELDQKFSGHHRSSIQIDIFKRDYDSETKKNWQLELALLGKIYQECQKNKISFLLVLGNLNHQVRTQSRIGFFKRYRKNIKEEKYVFNKPNEILKFFANEHSIPVLDLLPVFKQEEESKNMVHFIFDGHWNSYGNRLAAELTLNKLVEEKLIPLKRNN